MKPDLLLLMRERAGLTQSALASRLDVTQSTISNVERGQRTPSLELLESWAQTCGYELMVVLSGPGTPPSPEDGPSPRPVSAESPSQQPTNTRPAQSAVINLRRLRREAGLTQQALADALGIGRSYVSKLERGAAEVDLTMAQRWARVCGREIGLLGPGRAALDELRGP